MTPVETKELNFLARLTVDVPKKGLPQGAHHLWGFPNNPKRGTVVYVHRWFAGTFLYNADQSPKRDAEGNHLTEGGETLYRVYVPGTKCDMFQLEETLAKQWLKAERNHAGQVLALNAKQTKELEKMEENFQWEMSR